MSLKIITNKILISSFLFLFFVCAAFSGGMFFAAKKVSDVNFVKNIVYKNTGLFFQSEEIEARYGGASFFVWLPEFSIGEKDSFAPFVKAKNTALKINIFSLLTGKISIPELKADSVEINLSRLEDGSFDIFKYFGRKKSFFKINLAALHVDVPSYTVNINDTLLKSKFALHGYSFIGRGLDINKTFLLNTEGAFSVSYKSGERVSPYLINLDFSKDKKGLKINKQEIVLSGFDTSFLKNYFDKFGFDTFDAVLDIYSNPSDDETFRLSVFCDKLNLAFDYKGERNTMVSNKPLVADIDFQFSDNDLILKNASFAGDGINILAAGKIKNFLKIKNIEPELNVKLTDVELKKLVQILPDTLIPFQEPYVKTLKLHNVNAIVNGSADVKFKNTEDFGVFGKLDFSDVYVVKRPLSAKTSFGSCEFKGRDVFINVYANAPNDAVLTVFGKSRMQKSPYGEFDIKSFGKLDLAFAHEILMPVQDILALKLGPLPFMTLKGTGEIELHTKGTKEKSNLTGFFETNDAKVTLDGLNALLVNGNVKVLFDGSDIIFNGAKGLIDGAPVQIDGTADTGGNLNIDVNVSDISAKAAMKIAQTSSIVTDALDGGEFLKSFKPETGNLDFYLNISGNVPPDAVFGQQSDTVFAKGKIIFKGNSLTIEPQIKGKNLKGVLTFEDNAEFNLTADIYDSPFKITGKVEQKGAQNKVLHGVPSSLSIRFVSDDIKSSSVGKFILENIELFIPQNRMFVSNLAQIFNTNRFKMKADVSASGLVYSDAVELDLSGFDFSGFVEGVNTSGSDFNFKGGNITLKGKNVKFDKLRATGSGIDFLMDGNIDKFASLKPFNNLKITFFESSFESYVSLIKKILPAKMQNIFNSFKDFKGTVSGFVKLYSDKIDGEFIPSSVSFFDSKSGNRIVLTDGRLKLKNEKTYFKAFNLLYGILPVYFDGFVQTDGDVNPEFNIFVSANLSEEASDKLINPYLQYPLLVSGEVTLKSRLQGRLNSYVSYLTLVADEGSDFSFMGLRLGDIDSKREISSKIRFNGSYADINYIRYFKYILSQSNKQTPYDLIRISGGVKLKDGGVLLNNLRVLTPNPAPVRFLNILFKKSIIKDGKFTSNLLLNGSPADIKAEGSINFSRVFVPLYNSFIDDIKIELNKNTGRASFILSVFDTVGEIVVDFENKMGLPVVINNFSAHSDSVSIENLMKAFTLLADSASKASKASVSSSGQSQNITPSDIQINKGAVTVDKILFNGVEADNLKLNFSHSKDSSLKIDDTYVAIAGGLIKGSGNYKFDTKDIEVNADFINCDANELTKAFFNLGGEIYGNANGKFSLSMKDFTPSDYVKKINANAEFEILNGRLPKLGSIEYLLRASNFFKSGIFGLTLNNIIDLLTPYKHGDFNKISGNFKIADAKIKDLKIYSQGDNLSTYTYGSYDILSGISEIEILGKLSKKVSSLLGPVGNASVVSILNAVTRNKMDELMKSELMKNIGKIPLIDLSNDDYRLFNVKLQGEVSKDDVVKSFSWLN